MQKRILHLTLKKKWFDLIASGEKKVEYREYKRHWIKRLCEVDWEGSFLFHKQFDEIHFRNGYRKDSPFMRVGHLRTEVCIDTFNIYLGKVLEVTK